MAVACDMYIYVRFSKAAGENGGKSNPVKCSYVCGRYNARHPALLQRQSSEILSLLSDERFSYFPA